MTEEEKKNSKERGGGAGGEVLEIREKDQLEGQHEGGMVS